MKHTITACIICIVLCLGVIVYLAVDSYQLDAAERAKCESLGGELFGIDRDQVCLSFDGRILR